MQASWLILAQINCGGVDGDGKKGRVAADGRSMVFLMLRKASSDALHSFPKNALARAAAPQRGAVP